ncbi:MAG: hypothetical protein EHM55_23315 [Acidobacteria bacterium]|nr:MAG: hypothetical protein EHM55_23315 [Acidobacteriota bacterium]
MKTELKDRCARIEEAYEFMLAYAAQGLRTEPGGGVGSQIRTMLTTCDKSLSGLSDVFTQIVRGDNLQPAAAYDNFIAVLARDAKEAQASIQLVLAQQSISSQMVDNLNASIHLRALLTDLFLIDEIVRPEAASVPSANAPTD